MATQMHVAFSSLFMGVGMIGGSKYAQLSFIINHFSGPVIERSFLFVCLCVRAITLELNGLCTSYSARWFVLTIFRSRSKVKVIGQSSRIG